MDNQKVIIVYGADGNTDAYDATKWEISAPSGMLIVLSQAGPVAAYGPNQWRSVYYQDAQK